MVAEERIVAPCFCGTRGVAATAENVKDVVAEREIAGRRAVVGDTPVVAWSHINGIVVYLRGTGRMDSSEC